ncbi:hypothetical protein [Acutalibacter intestini]|uniref:hypothetical protein n=1 Tax=Acutalibacter intestini TaxID=3093659 RepID=UPI002AC93DF8|nr:hypothetical protein [Acutalibacter sp. M00204]
MLQFIVLWCQGVDSILYKMTVPIICTLPYACGWLDDYKGGFFKLALVRGRMRGYIWGKFLACGVSGGGVEVLSAWLFCAVKKGQPSDYGLLFLSSAVWAAVAAVLAALSNSKYLAYGGSFVIYYFLIIICERYWPGLYCLYPYEWLSPQHTWVWGNKGVMVLLSGVILVLGLWHYSVLQRRVEHA